MEEFKYYGFLFKSRRRVEEDTDRRKAFKSMAVNLLVDLHH